MSIVVIGALVGAGPLSSGVLNPSATTTASTPPASLDPDALDLDALDPNALDPNAAAPSDDESPADEAGDELAFTRSSADGTPEPSDLEGVERLWVGAGTAPALASCYRAVLEEAGIQRVADLNELASVVETLSEPGRRAMNDCAQP